MRPVAERPVPVGQLRRVAWIVRHPLSLTLFLLLGCLAFYGAHAPVALAPPLADRLWYRGFHSLEHDPQGEAFRWIGAWGMLPLPRLSTGPHLLILHLEQPRPAIRALPLRITYGIRCEITVLPGRRVYRLLLPGSLLPTDNALILESETFRSRSDRRHLSVVVRGVRLTALPGGIPWWMVIAAGFTLQTLLGIGCLHLLAIPQRWWPVAVLLIPLQLWLSPYHSHSSSAVARVWLLVGVLGGALPIAPLMTTLRGQDVHVRIWERIDFLIAGGLALLAGAVRVMLIPHQIPILNGDDYLTGSFAGNILLRGWHALYFGHHTGALSAYLIAPVMAVAGISHLSLLVLPITLTVVLTVVLYGLGMDLFGRWGGFVAGLWVALPSATFLWWTLKPQPGYLEAITFAALALWMTVRLLWGDLEYRAAVWHMVGIALTAFLALWAGLVVASVWLVGGLIALIRWRQALKLPPPGYALSAVIGLGLLAPTIVYIYERPNDNPLWWVIGRGVTGLPPHEALSGLINRTSLLILGIVRPWPLSPVPLPVAVAMIGLTIGGIVVGTGALLGRSRAALIPISLTAFTTLLFGFSSFNRLLGDVRYVLPIYLALPLFAALLIVTVRRRFGPYASLGLLVILIGLHTWSGVGGMRTIPPTWEREEARLARALLDRQIRYVHTSYWIAQVLMVESNGQILASAMLGPHRESYDRRVEEAVLAADPQHVALVLRTDEGLDAPLTRYLARRRVSCSRFVVESFSVYLHCSPPINIADLQRNFP